MMPLASFSNDFNLCRQCMTEEIGIDISKVMHSFKATERSSASHWTQAL
jgi:hypothetical protein